MPSELTPATVSVASPRYGWLVSTVANSGALATPVSAAQTRSRRSSSGSGRAGEKPGLLRCSTEVHQPPSREVSDVLLWLVLFGRLGARVPLLFGSGFRRDGGAPRLPARAGCPLWRLARRPLIGRRSFPSTAPASPRIVPACDLRGRSSTVAAAFRMLATGIVRSSGVRRPSRDRVAVSNVLALRVDLVWLRRSFGSSLTLPHWPRRTSHSLRGSVPPRGARPALATVENSLAAPMPAGSTAQNATASPVGRGSRPARYQLLPTTAAESVLPRRTGCDHSSATQGSTGSQPTYWVSRPPQSRPRVAPPCGDRSPTGTEGARANLSLRTTWVRMSGR